MRTNKLGNLGLAGAAGSAILFVLTLTISSCATDQEQTQVAKVATPAPMPDKGPYDEAPQKVVDEKGCLACHEGIADFTDGKMMKKIKKWGQKYAGNDTAGCTVCHGGNSKANTKAEAHNGAPAALTAAEGPDAFYPDPGSLWIAEKSCGQCHEGYTNALQKSLMATEAGKLQGNLWSWGVVKELKAPYGNFDVKDDDMVPEFGTDTYKEYMAKFIKDHPDQIVSELKQVPEVDINQVSKHPQLAGLTYSRQQCQRCHVGVNGREKRGDYRGAGCSSCHVPYGNEGKYEGNDPTIDKNVPGKLLVHQMQSGRNSKVTVGDRHYSGIPNETCSSCHNRGKRIGVSYQGIMEMPYGSPYDGKGAKQSKLHTKKYHFIDDDLHHEAGMLCQDCHTSIDMHGDGNIPGTTLAQVEIECEDCHGTVEKYPWDLPLGAGEEFQQEIGNTPRGLTKRKRDLVEDATTYDPEDGYLLSARGNPLGNVVRRGNKVILHSATGKDHEVPVLREIAKTDTWNSKAAKVSMAKISQHTDSMECYACHADWAPQCYGCHVTVDYSKGKTDIDWIKNVNQVGKDGLTADAPLGTNGLTSSGKVSETRSYLRWETPTLGINGEGRVSPLMPGCQVITTVIDKDGKTIVNNQIWETPKGKGIDHAAAQPHTASKKSRDCESCHNNPKALGYGIEGGRFMLGQEKDRVVDLEMVNQPIPKSAKAQIPAIPKLDHDLSAIVDRADKQLVSVGSHWPLSGPLPKEMRDKMERSGLCMGCHEHAGEDKLWAAVNTPEFTSNEAHQEVMDKAMKALAETQASK